MNNNSTLLVPNPKDGFDASGFSYGIAFVLGLIFLLLSITFACVRLRMYQSPNFFHFLAGISQGEGLVEARQQGLHHVDTTFETFPKMLYAEVVQKEGTSSNINSSSGCSICLGDYKESDMLRLLPDCGHIFHLSCVDPWLRLHSTCPICRSSSSSVQNPQSNSASTGESL